ncbi:MAG: hypothetical protein ACSLFN_04780 [Candidatus Limnocylindrales bacterium]
MRGIVGLAIVSALVLAGCYVGPGPEHYVAIVEELDVPAGWQLAKSNVFGPDEDDPCEPFTSLTCPGAGRFFVVDGDAANAYAQAKAVVVAPGFAITEEFRVDCTGGSSGSACSFFASRDGDQLTVSVFHSGADVGLGEDVVAGAVVVITAHRD